LLVVVSKKKVMPHPNVLLSTLIFIFTATACRKEAATSSRCEALKQSLISGDREQARVAITAMIDKLPAKVYTKEGLDMLSDFISGQCSITAEVDCFNCIKTLPSQTEIEVYFISAGSQVHRTIDITYTPSNEMRFSNIHE
jgi:hypothetical protein